MCWSEGQANQLVRMYSLHGVNFSLEFAECAGARFDYGPHDFAYEAKRRKVVAEVLRGLAGDIENGTLTERSCKNCAFVRNCQSRKHNAKVAVEHPNVPRTCHKWRDPHAHV